MYRPRNWVRSIHDQYTVRHIGCPRMAIGKINTRTVEALRKEAIEGRAGLYLWDTELRGFGCRATPSGGLSWLFQHWIGGKGGRPKRIAFGLSPPMKIDEARKEAERLRGDVNKGIDLLDRKARARKARLDQLQSPKVGDAVALYLARNGKPGRYWEELEDRFKNEIVAAIGRDRMVSTITKEEIRALIEQKEDTHPGAARTLFAVLRPFFKWCVERDIISVSPIAELSAPSPIEARDRLLTRDEIKAFWSAADQMGHPFCAFYRLLLLTGQRREEVAGMRWQELDLRGATWTIPKERTKNNTAHIVHLSDQALAVLSGIAPAPVCPFIFSTTGRTSISGYSKAKRKLDGLMGITHDPKAKGYDLAKLWRVHDLRRTLASTLAELGVPTDVADRLLNHLSGSRAGVKGVYQRYEFLAERKRAIEMWGAYVDQLVSDKPAHSNVVALRA